MSRLDKILSHVLGVPRQKAHALVRHGSVTVGGELVTDPGAKVDPAAVEVALEGRVLPPPGPVVLIMHKPAGVISATEDGRDTTVLDLVPPELRRRGLAPIGRLDKDTTGLILLSDDGALSHALTHPRRHVGKVYRVMFAGNLAPDATERVRDGLVLGDGTRCLPGTLVIDAGDTCRLTIHEGKHHQVKRMIAVLGATVTALHRERLGGLDLPPDLAPGQVRRATPTELAALAAVT